MNKAAAVVHLHMKFRIESEKSEEMRRFARSSESSSVISASFDF
jgi:hypothetical protein